MKTDISLETKPRIHSLGTFAHTYRQQDPIESALMKLLKDNDLEKITINSIAEEADVSRGTIYLNYEDKYHITESYMDKELNRFRYMYEKGNMAFNATFLLELLTTLYVYMEEFKNTK